MKLSDPRTRKSLLLLGLFIGWAGIVLTVGVFTGAVPLKSAAVSAEPLPATPAAVVDGASSGFSRVGNVQEEADVKAGFNLGRSIGLKRKAEGFSQPTMEYLDGILRLTCPTESQAYKTGFKAGYLAAFQRVVPDALH